MAGDCDSGGPPPAVGLAVALVGHALEGKAPPASINLAVSLVGHLATKVDPLEIVKELIVNKLLIAHTRPDPGVEDAEERKEVPHTEPKGVPSDYIIYDEKGKEIKRGKYTNEDGSPLEVDLPPEYTLVTVRFEHDNDKQFVIVHEPKPHGLIDATKPPTPDQLARIKMFRLA